MTKPELALLIRRLLRDAAQDKGTPAGLQAARRAAMLTRCLRRWVFHDRLMALITQFPKRIAFGV